MERIRPFIKILIIILILFGFVTCKEPTDLIDALDDEVKQANGLYLEIVNITPDNNATNVDPGDNIQIEFDRDINETDLDSYITLLNEEGTPFTSEVADKSLEFSFNTTNKVLTITAEPYLDGLVEYTLNIQEGLQGKDGSQLREPVSRVFDTKDTPRGFFEINRDYTNQTSIDATIETQGATFYMVSYNKDFSGAGWEIITSGVMTIEELEIAGTAGENTLYAKFRDGSVDEAGTANISSVEEDTIIFDDVAPGITFPDDIVYSNDSSSVDMDPTVTDNSGDGAIESYLWEEVEGDTIDITGETTKTGTFSAGSGNDGNYTMRLTVTDKAGNSASKDFTYTCDSVPPTLDIGSSYTQKSNTDLDLSASATDNIGIKSYTWEKISGTGTVSFDSTDSSDVKLQLDSEDTYTLRVTVYDLAGNSFSKDIEVICSDTAPVITFPNSVNYLNSTNYNTDSVVLQTEIDSAIAYTYEWTTPTGITITPNSGSGSGSANTIELTPTINGAGAADGKYTLTLEVTSAAATTTSDVSIYKDVVAPSIYIGTSTLYANDANRYPTISGSVSDGTSGIASLSWSSQIVSGATNVTFSKPSSSYTSVYLNYDGEAAVRLSATDKAGNTNNGTSRTVIRDTVAPSPPSVSYTSPTSDTSPDFTLTAGSGGTGTFRYMIEGGTLTNFKGSVVSPALDYGSTQLYFYGMDAAGNWSTYNSEQVVVYPIKTVYPGDGTTIYAPTDIAWRYTSGYYYKFYIGAGIRPSLLGSYRSDPCVNSSEIHFSYGTTYTWYYQYYTLSGKLYLLAGTSPTYTFTYRGKF